MPLADHAGVIARRLQILRNRRLRTIEPIEHRHAVDVGIFPGQYGRATRRTDRIGHEAIVKAQEIGVAETDPWYDLDGWDSVMKTTILANTLLEGNLSPKMVEREGISGLTMDEICAAALAGLPYRLVSQAHRKNGILFAEVRPFRISSDDTLRIAKGTTGVISLETEAMGTITLVEHEPAVLQTAYGVLSDLITIQRQRSL